MLLKEYFNDLKVFDYWNKMPSVIFIHLIELIMKNTEFKPRADVKQRIETTAIRLISDQNSRELSFVNVAEAAHCSLQTLYRYYGTIENLWMACGARVLKKLSDRLMDHLQGLKDTKERFRKAFWLMLDFFERNERSVEFFMSSVHFQTWMENVSFKQPEISQLMLKMISEGQQAGILTTEVDKVAILDFIYGVLFRFIQMHQLRREKVSNATRANALFEMLWRAIARPQD